MTEAGLAQTLKSYACKERFWLIRSALGDAAQNLDSDFMRRIADVSGLSPIPSDAFWATDFHLDWIVAALRQYTLGTPANCPERWDPEFSIAGNQEDIDLVIAYGRKLILIEAKGVLNWTSKQIKSKLQRLGQLWGEDGISRIGAPDRQVELRFILSSPRRPVALEKAINFPSWARGNAGHPRWLPLHPPPMEAGLMVSRCDAGGKLNRNGEYRKITTRNPWPPNPPIESMT